MRNAALEHQIDVVIAALIGPHIENIRWEIKPDQSGDEAVFARVIVSDDAAHDLSRVVARDTRALWDTAIVQPLSGLREAVMEHSGMVCYIYFRSHSEQEVLKDPDWAPLKVSQ